MSQVGKSVRIAVTGASWVPVASVLPRLERELRIHPGLVLVTQPHFLGKIQAWARKHGILVECVEGTNRYSSNEKLLYSGALEFLVFAKDRFTEHLNTCITQNLDKPLVRHYD